MICSGTLTGTRIAGSIKIIVGTLRLRPGPEQPKGGCGAECESWMASKMLRRLSLILTLAATFNGAPALAEAPERTSTLVVYGGDPCPAGEGDEIVVCARRPESERFRIPKSLRHKEDPPAETSWVSRSEALDDVQRFTRPNSCSVVGSAGQTGCLAEMLARWRAEQRARRAGMAGIP